MAKPKKKRNKKYNPNRIAPVAADASLRQNKLAVWSTCDMENAKVLSMRTKKLFDPAQKTAHLIADYPHFWHYTLVVYCRKQTGEEYIVTGEPELPDEKGIPLSERRLDQAKLAEALDKAHKEFMEGSVNPLHIVNTGWVAFPYKAEIDEQTICEIADAHGAWGYLSRYEAQIKEAAKKRVKDEEGITQLKSKKLPDW